eukprot:COSAG03_NODE_338_length_8851_cov_33.536106_13_plen_87_part_00
MLHSNQNIESIHAQFEENNGIAVADDVLTPEVIQELSLPHSLSLSLPLSRFHSLSLARAEGDRGALAILRRVHCVLRDQEGRDLHG